jgi:hypothetical protein
MCLCAYRRLLLKLAHRCLGIQTFETTETAHSYLPLFSLFIPHQNAVRNTSTSPTAT